MGAVHTKADTFADITVAAECQSGFGYRRALGCRNQCCQARDDGGDGDEGAEEEEDDGNDDDNGEVSAVFRLYMHS